MFTTLTKLCLIKISWYVDGWLLVKVVFFIEKSESLDNDKLITVSLTSSPAALFFAKAKSWSSLPAVYSVLLVGICYDPGGVLSIDGKVALGDEVELVAAEWQHHAMTSFPSASLSAQAKSSSSPPKMYGVLLLVEIILFLRCVYGKVVLENEVEMFVAKWLHHFVI